MRASVAYGWYAGSSTPEPYGDPWMGEIAVKPSAAAVRTKSASTASPSNHGRGRVGRRSQVLRRDEQVALQRRLRLVDTGEHAPVEALDAGAVDQGVDPQRVDDLGDERLAGGELGGVEGVVLDLEVDPHRVRAPLAQQRRDLAQQWHRGWEVGAGQPADQAGVRECRVVGDDHVVLGRQVDVELERRDTEREGAAEGLEGVLGPEAGAAAVGLQVEGHEE